MEIYIDETGSFARPGERKKAISCVGALSVPSAESPHLFERLDRLIRRWGSSKWKGSQLTEMQFVELFALCRKFCLHLEIRATDVSLQSPGDLAAFRAAQGALIQKGADRMLHEEPRKFLSEQRQYAETELSDQLFIQAILLVSLIEDVLRETIPFYAFRRPQELGTFRWRVDAKDVTETNLEKLWRLLLLPMLQSASVRQPFAYPREGDYAALERFDRALPEYIEQFAKEDGVEIRPEAAGSDLGKIVNDDFRVCSDEEELGLQLVDFAVAAVRRGMMGTLKPQGWKDVAVLMTSTPSLVHLDLPGERDDLDITDPKVLAVLRWIDANRKSLIPSRYGAGPKLTLKR